MLDLIKWLMPPDQEKPQQMWSYLRRMALTLMVAFFVLFFIVIPAMFYALPKVGSLAWAGEIDTKIDTAMNAKLKPVNDKLQELTNNQKEQGDILTELATASLRADICRYAGRRVLERDPAERARLLDQIEHMKERYYKYAKREFDTGEC